MQCNAMQCKLLYANLNVQNKINQLNNQSLIIFTFQQPNMFDVTPKPQFHNYPLNKYELMDLNNSRNALDTQINNNRKQIQSLNNKFNNDQYQQAYLQRLYEKDKMLMLKKQEYDQVMRLNQFHDNQYKRQKQTDLKYKSSLASQYKRLIQQNRFKKSQQKKRQQEQQREILNKNLFQIQKNQRQLRNHKSQKDRTSLLKNLQIEDSLKHKAIQQRQKQKKYFQQNYDKNKSKVTQKQEAFINYYRQNQNNVSKIENIYKNSYQPVIKQQETKILQKQRKNISDYNQMLKNKQQNFVNERAQSNQQLKNYLQSQINRKSFERSFQSSQKLATQRNNVKNQVNNQQYEQEQKMNRKRDQMLYASELEGQMNNQSLHRSFQLTDDNIVGKIYQSQSFHNAVSNPISLGIGMINPYILRQYQNRHRKYQNEGRSSNIQKYHKLAQIANISLIS